jgi:hypothetical protein
LPNIFLPDPTYQKLEGALRMFNFLADRDISLETFVDAIIREKIEAYKEGTQQSKDLSHPFLADGKVMNRFKAIAKRQGFRATEIVDRTGIDKSTLSYILSNKSQPSTENLLKLWVLFGKPNLEHLFEKQS